MRPFSSPFGACTQCTFNYGPKCRFLWLQIRIFPTPKMRLFPASALMALGCWHRWLCDYSELSEWRRPRRPRGCAKAPDRPQMLSQCHKTPPAAKSQSQTETKIPSFRSCTPFVASFDSEPMSFFVQRITRPVALLTWPAGMEKRGNGWCSIPGQGPNNPGG